MCQVRHHAESRLNARFVTARAGSGRFDQSEMTKSCRHCGMTSSGTPPAALGNGIRRHPVSAQSQAMAGHPAAGAASQLDTCIAGTTDSATRLAGDISLPPGGAGISVGLLLPTAGRRSRLAPLSTNAAQCARSAPPRVATRYSPAVPRWHARQPVSIRGRHASSPGVSRDGWSARKSRQQ